MARVLPAGKLPNLLLDEMVSKLLQDPAVLVGPGVGEDVAVIHDTSDHYLVLKTDPITFATDQIGYYAVHVNANDIASSGGEPKWFLTTLLFPPDTTDDTIRGVSREIAETAEAAGITICGGHTEITAAVNQTVVCGAMAGTVPEEHLKRKESVQPGNRIIMTKTAGNEGTAVLAAECSDTLSGYGVPSETLQSALRFLDRLSVLPEARLARAVRGVSAMHDVTEGGVATALIEIVAPSGCGVDVDLDCIPVDPATRVLCEALGLDPLGLIGSGSLLIAAAEADSGDLLNALNAAGIAAAEIAEVTLSGMAAHRGATQVAFPYFERDEIARMFED